MIPAKIPDPDIAPFECFAAEIELDDAIPVFLDGKFVCLTMEDTKELGLWIANRTARDEALEACNLVREEGAE